GRELGEALALKLAMLDGRYETAAKRLEQALALADTSDIFGAASLTAEVGEEIRPHAPELVGDALLRYANRPEVQANPKIKARFTVLLIDSKSTIDRSGRVR
ncbi:MAG: hypothetical protein ACJ8AD_21095, partial [Gemmatimonadaceae bacterium]